MKKVWIFIKKVIVFLLSIPVIVTLMALGVCAAAATAIVGFGAAVLGTIALGLVAFFLVTAALIVGKDTVEEWCKEKMNE